MNINKMVNWFIPGSMQADEQLYIRAKSNVAVSFAICIAGIIYSFLYALMHHPGGTITIITVVLLFVFPAPFIMRCSRSTKVSGNLITLGMFLILVFLAVTSGGIYAQSISWFATVPILGALLAGFGFGIFWGVLSTVSLVSLYILKLSGYTFPVIALTSGEDLAFRFIVLVGLVNIIMAFALLFEGLKNSAFKRSVSFGQLKDTFAKISANAKLLTNSSNELTSTSEIIEQNAGDSLNEVSRMAGGVSEVNQNIHTLAASIAQVTTGIQDISKNTVEAADVSQEAVTMVDTINRMIEKLSENNKEIGKITTMLTDIAFQTNLLALNAAIEAARAGEAGRGFAVVAGAVRTLSLEASEAAHKISDNITVVREDTETAIDAIKRVNETIYKFNDLMNYIASEVKEQDTTLTQMSQNAGKAANETSRIAESSQSVSRAAESTSKGINDIFIAAKEMSKMAEFLKGLTRSSGHTAPETG